MDNLFNSFSLVLLPVEEPETENTAHSLFIPGEICPFCGQAVLDYDGLLNLVCPACGRAESGCFT